MGVKARKHFRGEPMGDEAGRTVARAEAVEMRGLRRRGAPTVPAGRDIPAVPAGSGAPAVPDGMEGGTTGGGRGGKGRRGTPAGRVGIG